MAKYAPWKFYTMSVASVTNMRDGNTLAHVKEIHWHIYEGNTITINIRNNMFISSCGELGLLIMASGNGRGRNSLHSWQKQQRFPHFIVITIIVVKITIIIVKITILQDCKSKFSKSRAFVSFSSCFIKNSYNVRWSVMFKSLCIF